VKKKCSLSQNAAMCPVKHPNRKNKVVQYMLLSTSRLTDLSKTRCKAKGILMQLQNIHRMYFKENNPFHLEVAS